MSDQSEVTRGTEGETVEKSPGSEAPVGAPDESGETVETPGQDGGTGDVTVNTEGGDAVVDNG